MDSTSSDLDATAADLLSETQVVEWLRARFRQDPELHLNKPMIIWRRTSDGSKILWDTGRYWSWEIFCSQLVSEYLNEVGLPHILDNAYTVDRIIHAWRRRKLGKRAK